MRRSSQRFEPIEWLEASVADMLGLARRRAKRADLTGVLGAAARASGCVGEQPARGIKARWLGRGDAVAAQLLTGLVADPVRGPGWGKDGAQLNVVVTSRGDHALDLGTDRIDRRAARVGRRDRDHDVPLTVGIDSPEDPEVLEAQDRDF